MTSVNARGYLTPTPTPGPSIGWLVVSSLWLIPVFLGGGTTTWIGFAIIGLALLRGSWIVAAAIYAVLAFLVSVLDFLALGPMLQIPIIVVGSIHALIVNRTWLATLWGRSERGERMLGRGGARAAAPAPAVPPVPSLPPAGIRPAAPAAVTPSLLAALAEEQAAATAVPVTPPESIPLALLEPPQPAPTQLPPPTATPISDPLRSTAPTSTPSSAQTPLRVDPISTVLTSALGISAITSLQQTVLGASSVVLPPREALNPMTATQDALASIPVIGQAGAARIVAAREHHTLNSLQAVADAAGLQGFELVRIRPFFRFD